MSDTAQDEAAALVATYSSMYVPAQRGVYLHYRFDADVDDCSFTFNCCGFATMSESSLLPMCSLIWRTRVHSASAMRIRRNLSR